MITGFEPFDRLNDKVKHIIVMLIITVVIVPTFIYIFDREAGNIISLITSVLIILGKEAYDGWKNDWIMDIFAGLVGIFIGFVIGGALIARVFLGV